MKNIKAILLVFGFALSATLAVTVWHNQSLDTTVENQTYQGEPSILGASSRRRIWRNKTPPPPPPVVAPPPVALPPPTTPNPTPTTSTTPFKMLKDVGEPFYSKFGLSETDFQKFQTAKIGVIQGNFDICANPDDVDWLLDTAQKYSIKVILNAGSGEAEWGYECDAPVAANQKPVLEKAKVAAWVNKWKNYPALYAWDTSNEAGGNFPNAYRLVDEGKKWEEEFSVSLTQLREVYSLVKQNDPTHPVMIRMNGWFFFDFEDNFFRSGNPFGTGVADLVMINTYSNVDTRDPLFVSTVWDRAYKSIKKVDPSVKFIAALAAWKGTTIFVQMPTPSILQSETNTVLKIPDMVGVSFFKYGSSTGNGWLLPDARRGSSTLWQTISNLNMTTTVSQ